jgi:hypothetical protein
MSAVNFIDCGDFNKFLVKSNLFITSDSNEWAIEYNNILDKWIKDNEKTEKKSEKIYNQFITKIKIEGSEEFNSTVMSVIKDASCLVSGSTIFERIGKVSKGIIFKQEEQSSCRTNGEICLSFHRTLGVYVFPDKYGEWKLKEESKIATFLHECIHHYHNQIDQEGAQKRRKGKSLILNMTNQEEEKTIMGWVKGIERIDNMDVCENTVNRELRMGIRINHAGLKLKENQSLTICDMIKLRALSSIRKELKNPNLNKNEIYPQYSNQTALDLGLYLYLRNKNKVKKQQYEEIIELMIRGGFKSENALKIGVLKNSLRLVQVLIEFHEKPSTDLLDLTLKADESSLNLLAAKIHSLECAFKGAPQPSIESGEDLLKLMVIIKSISLKILKQCNYASTSKLSSFIPISLDKRPTSTHFRLKIPLEMIELLITGGANPSQNMQVFAKKYSKLSKVINNYLKNNQFINLKN